MRAAVPHILALSTVAMFAWVGLTLVSARPVLGGVLLALALFRLGAWLHRLWRAHTVLD